MSAPTPISALLHSSTLVILGVYLGIIVVDSVLLLLDLCIWFVCLFYCLVCFTLLFCSFIVVLVSDVKSIIAFSTICQLSYMFYGLVINCVVCGFHVIVHALFKSLLFILAGSIINVQLNKQSIYRIRISDFFIGVCFILLLFILSFSLTKE